PALFGELVLGLALGPFVLHWLDGSPTFGVLGDLGVLLLMLLVGLETDLSTLRSVGFTSFVVATCGALLPFGTGTYLALQFGQPLDTALFIGVALSATSVSITAATLRELGRLQTRAGSTILMAAVIDDVLGLILLAFVTGQHGGQSPAIALLRLALVVGLTVVSAMLIKPLLKVLEGHIEGFLALAVGFAFFFAWSAETLGGLAPITGAYIAGLLLAHALPHQPLARGIETMASGFFATIFFVSLGLHVRVDSVSWSLLAIFFGLAIVTKLIGCGVGAFIGRLGLGDALAVGIGMIPRGEVALIVASLGLQQRILSTSIFSMLVLMAAGTTLITPILLKGVFSLAGRGEQRKSQQFEQRELETPPTEPTRDAPAYGGLELMQEGVR
ncbi:MAG: cation:proton antiporter, partial [Ktedonobacterales bacterium]